MKHKIKPGTYIYVELQGLNLFPYNEGGVVLPTNKYDQIGIDHIIVNNFGYKKPFIIFKTLGKEDITGWALLENIEIL